MYINELNNRSLMHTKDLYALQMEVEILSQVYIFFLLLLMILLQIDHPNVVKLYEVFEDKTRFFLIFELMTGGGVNIYYDL